MMYQLWDNHSNCIAAAGTEVYCKHIGLIIMFARVGMDKVTGFLADVRIVFQRPRHSGGGDVQRPGNILDGYLRFIHEYDLIFRSKIMQIVTDSQIYLDFMLRCRLSFLLRMKVNSVNPIAKIMELVKMHLLIIIYRNVSLCKRLRMVVFP